MGEWRWTAENDRPRLIYGELKSAVKAGNIKEVFRLTMIVLNHIPQWTYPAGIEAYYEVSDREGKESAFARHNLWRAVWHTMAGMVLAALLWIVPPSATMMIIFAVALTHEFSDSGITKNQISYESIARKFTLKNMWDVFTWMAGGFLVVGLQEMLYG